MTTLVSQEITGQGSYSWGSIIKIDHVSVAITTLGYHSEPDAFAADRVLRAGYFAMGVNFDQGVGALDYWSDARWIDWTGYIWAPPSDIFAFFERIRWSLSSGTVAWLLVESS